MIDIQRERKAPYIATIFRKYLSDIKCSDSQHYSPNDTW